MEIGQVLFEIQAIKDRTPHAVDRFPLSPRTGSALKILLTFDLIFDLLFHLKFYNQGMNWNCHIEIFHLICVSS